jgi:hypothetical protein
MGRCPICRDSSAVTRVHRIGWETYLRPIGANPYYCSGCGKRFIGFERRVSKPQGFLARPSSIPQNIQSKYSGVRRPESSAERFVAAIQSPVTIVSKPASPPASIRKKAKPQIRQTIWSFAVLLLLDITIGNTEYQSLGQSAMWVNLMTLAAVVGGILTYINLRQARIGAAGSVSFTTVLVLSWIAMTVICDALIGVVLVPSIANLPLNWGFFHQQSPWIWLYCAVLPLAGLGGCVVYRMSLRD